jgi:hypothetical protein
MSRAPLLLALVVLAACGDGSAPDTAPVPSSGPLYLVQTRVLSPEASTGVLVPLPSLDATGPVSTARALVQPGGGVLYRGAEPGVFLVGSAEEPVLTRYELGPDDEMLEGARLSFANQGVVFLYPGSVVILDATRAYYLDLDQSQAIAFDPTAMAITATISLAGVRRDGFLTGFGGVIVRDDGLYFSGHWYTDPEPDRTPAGSMLIHLDPATNEVTITSDARCTGMLLVSQNVAGDAYWFSDSYNTFARRGYGNGVPDCGLRLLAGETTFDPTFALDITARTGGAAAVPVLRASDTQVWLRVLDEASAGELPVPADFGTLDSTQAWQWHLLDLASDAPAVRNDDRPLASAGALGMAVDGRSFTAIGNADDSETTLLEITPAGFIERGTFQGIIDDIVRVR